MTPDSGEAESARPADDAPDELLWDKARTAVASLEFSASAAPRSGF